MNTGDIPPDFLKRLGRAARGIGAVALGIVAARPFDELRALLVQRQQDGTYPLFCQRDVVSRTDPERWLPGCRSVWVAAFAYAPPGAITSRRRPDQQGPRGRLAAYALPEEYHRHLHRRLRWLARWAARHSGRRRADFRVFVDTGPPVERDLWRRAGAGWIGKNTCAYAPGAGSWIVLGVVATRLPLPEGAVPLPWERDLGTAPPVPVDPCRECDRCIRACPTGALAPYRMQPERCIAQLSQRRGALSEAERASLVHWLFGCDLCQMACPYNQEAQAPLAFGAGAALRPVRGTSPEVPLVDILTMEPPAFRAGLGRGAVAWRGLSHLQRNAAYAAGVRLRRHAAARPASERASGTGAGERSTYRALVEALARLAASHPSPLVREASAWALAAPRPPARWADRRAASLCRTRPSAATSPPASARPDR
ncbi:QueG-associated DUF1730 domain-containing protein [Geochorda subterranea]|uniref:QueG-associated DUF1730 domain-containing protein n=1 Tax=Geochorda subterranea TaxID=3109564 RepID=A0ABZ1BT77_9FIRM|nr:QueG-associated DUF1730 domain-containing protein [Limnochorda sp. LNt]WRP15337.1 QueG-associated DUF1730 domain-containing protein [Limnochorda sp. LNt]